MTTYRIRRGMATVMGAAVLLLGGCVAGGGYGGGVDVGYGADYYEPYGYDYGGGWWGNGYYVGPGHGGWNHDHPGPGRRPGAGFRPAPAGHSMPSLPHGGGGGPRGGGGGGGHGGGGHH